MDKVSVQSIDYHGNRIRVFHYDGELWYIAQDLEPFMGRVRETLRLRMKRDKNIRRVYVEILGVTDNNIAPQSDNNIVGYVDENVAYGPYVFAAVNEYR